jgi:pimeloyl-ACP methyl ester carboxylesterase
MTGGADDVTSRRLDFPPYQLWETRAGSGTPVALVHGLSGSTRWWSRNIDALAEKHLVAAVDLVGFGRTQHFFSPPVILPPFPEATALLARWLETFGEPVHLVGHSMGGQLAIRLTAERPDLVRSLVLVNAAGMPFRFDLRPHVRSLPKPPYGGPRILRLLVPDFLRAGPASVAVAGTRVVFADLRELMHSIRVPTLLVWGENDPLVPLVYGQAMQQEIEGARLVAIPRAAHVAMWDAAEEFNRVVMEFVDEVESRAPSAAAPAAFSWGISGWTEVPSALSPQPSALSMAHRQAGRGRDIVLVHGLGMSSAYFAHLASELFDDGWSPVAPDLPGFGESADAAAGGPEEHARILATWADALGIRDAVWLGHSIGCNAVAHLARTRPDLVRRTVFVGPLWTRSRYASTRILLHLGLDAFREPLALYRHILRAYWRTGLARWSQTARRFAPDVTCPPDLPRDALLIAGTRDPIPDRTCMPLHEVPGAHACVFSHAREVAQLVRELALPPTHGGL